MNNNQPQILLIYYNFKGVGQIIRHLLCYLKIPFVDILIDEYQKQKLMFSSRILETLRSKVINQADLPAIIHNGQVVYELNQIMHYICLIYKHEDLLGLDLYQKARVCEILQIYNLKLVNNIRFTSNLFDAIHMRSLGGLQLLTFLDSKFSQFLKESGYVKELSGYLSCQSNQQFILGNITIIDFYFIESCKYTLSIFRNLDERLASEEWAQIASTYRLKKKAKGYRMNNLQFLRAMKIYQEHFYSQEFYEKNREYLESTCFFPRSLPKEHIAVMQKLQAVVFSDMYYKEKQ